MWAGIKKKEKKNLAPQSANSSSRPRVFSPRSASRSARTPPKTELSRRKPHRHGQLTLQAGFSSPFFFLRLKTLKRGATPTPTSVAVSFTSTARTVLVVWGETPRADGLPARTRFARRTCEAGGAFILFFSRTPFFL